MLSRTLPGCLLQTLADSGLERDEPASGCSLRGGGARSSWVHVGANLSAFGWVVQRLSAVLVGTIF